MTSRGEHIRVEKGAVVKQRFEVVAAVGSGNFSKVYRVLDLRLPPKERKKLPLAMKVIKKEYSNDAKYEKQMLQVLHKCDEDGTARVSKMHECFYWQDCPVFIMPIHGPSVRSRRLGINRGAVTYPKLIEFAYDVIETMVFIHFKCSMVHTDLKPENILISDSSVPEGSLGDRWVVCDFGSASICRMEKLDSDLISTRPYRAPEVVMGNRWHYAADMWSVGCILYEVAIGHRLFEIRDDCTHLHLMHHRIGRLPELYTRNAKYSSNFFNSRGEFRSTPEIIASKKCRLTPIREMFREHREFGLLLEGLFIYDPWKRLSAAEALSMPLFDGIRAARGASLPVLPTKEEKELNGTAPTSSAESTDVARRDEGQGADDDGNTDEKVGSTAEVSSGAAASQAESPAAGSHDHRSKPESTYDSHLKRPRPEDAAEQKPAPPGSSYAAQPTTAVAAEPRQKAMTPSSSSVPISTAAPQTRKQRSGGGSPVLMGIPSRGLSKAKVRSGSVSVGKQSVVVKEAPQHRTAVSSRRTSSTPPPDLAQGLRLSVAQAYTIVPSQDIEEEQRRRTPTKSQSTVPLTIPISVSPSQTPQKRSRSTGAAGRRHSLKSSSHSSLAELQGAQRDETVAPPSPALRAAAYKPLALAAVISAPSPRSPQRRRSIGTVLRSPRTPRGSQLLRSAVVRPAAENESSGSLEPGTTKQAIQPSRRHPMTAGSPAVTEAAGTADSGRRSHSVHLHSPPRHNLPLTVSTVRKVKPRQSLPTTPQEAPETPASHRSPQRRGVAPSGVVVSLVEVPEAAAASPNDCATVSATASAEFLREASPCAADYVSPVRHRQANTPPASSGFSSPIFASHLPISGSSTFTTVRMGGEAEIEGMAGDLRRGDGLPPTHPPELQQSSASLKNHGQSCHLVDKMSSPAPAEEAKTSEGASIQPGPRRMSTASEATPQDGRRMTLNVAGTDAAPPQPLPSCSTSIDSKSTTANYAVVARPTRSHAPNVLRYIPPPARPITMVTASIDRLKSISPPNASAPSTASPPPVRAAVRKKNTTELHRPTPDLKDAIDATAAAAASTDAAETDATAAAAGCQRPVASVQGPPAAGPPCPTSELTLPLRQALSTTSLEGRGRERALHSSHAGRRTSSRGTYGVESHVLETTQQRPLYTPRGSRLLHEEAVERSQRTVSPSLRPEAAEAAKASSGATPRTTSNWKRDSNQEGQTTREEPPQHSTLGAAAATTVAAGTASQPVKSHDFCRSNGRGIGVGVLRSRSPQTVNGTQRTASPVLLKQPAQLRSPRGPVAKVAGSSVRMGLGGSGSSTPGSPHSTGTEVLSSSAAPLRRAAAYSPVSAPVGLPANSVGSRVGGSRLRRTPLPEVQPTRTTLGQRTQVPSTSPVYHLNSRNGSSDAGNTAAAQPVQPLPSSSMEASRSSAELSLINMDADALAGAGVLHSQPSPKYRRDHRTLRRITVPRPSPSGTASLVLPSEGSNDAEELKSGLELSLVSKGSPQLHSESASSPSTPVPPPSVAQLKQQP